MTKIEFGTKLDFNNVLIRPKRSTLKSRSDVNLERTFKFKNSSLTWSGVPIMSANMDTTGTFEMAIEASKHNLITCIHKYYELEDWLKFINDISIFENNIDIFNHIAISSGSKETDLYKLY